MCSRLM